MSSTKSGKKAEKESKSRTKLNKAEMNEKQRVRSQNLRREMKELFTYLGQLLGCDPKEKVKNIVSLAIRRLEEQALLISELQAAGMVASGGTAQSASPLMRGSSNIVGMHAVPDIRTQQAQLSPSQVSQPQVQSQAQSQAQAQAQQQMAMRALAEANLQQAHARAMQAQAQVQAQARLAAQAQAAANAAAEQLRAAESARESAGLFPPDLTSSLTPAMADMSIARNSGSNGRSMSSGPQSLTSSESLIPGPRLASSLQSNSGSIVWGEDGGTAASSAAPSIAIPSGVAGQFGMDALGNSLYAPMNMVGAGMPRSGPSSFMAATTSYFGGPVPTTSVTPAPSLAAPPSTISPQAVAPAGAVSGTNSNSLSHLGISTEFNDLINSYLDPTSNSFGLNLSDPSLALGDVNDMILASPSEIVPPTAAQQQAKRKFQLSASQDTNLPIITDTLPPKQARVRPTKRRRRRRETTEGVATSNTMASNAEELDEYESNTQSG
ncbi:uncharacterized protein AMSG_09326 [Thecamonas trahens ATCC 50062]|uniref:Uncharacterized protein n=1 Tax=Thecamonas trahens ATCC 50062 TaxID=461836 RepID=A0A0L0DL11_THETB|nr:hypothetical protein AMSG_09326 [Thecamonas trahens ATCC 50062]KNC53034.1 hypothetical protein AMSG_09326 [Thecamonas trahens ATCC 50062]|eukprot:XP_013754712.1 hypothetical protein AMSG_09326 [Thecamonas trahens ATCC 50062]